MKIYDFTDGVKGKLLGYRAFDALKGHGGFPEIPKISGKEFCIGGCTDGKDWDAETFGVEAICYCDGCYVEDNIEFWSWNYTCKPEYAKKLMVEAKGRWNTMDTTELMK